MINNETVLTYICSFLKAVGVGAKAECSNAPNISVQFTGVQASHTRLASVEPAPRLYYNNVFFFASPMRRKTINLTDGFRSAYCKTSDC